MDPTNVCVFLNQPPVRAACLNHKVVVFEYWKVTATYIGSITILNKFILSHPNPPLSTVSGSF